MNGQAIEIRIAEDGSSVSLILQGAFSIENASDLRAACLESFEASSTVALNASMVESMDLTAVQVICSACKTAAAQGILFTPEKQLPDCLVTLGSSIGAQVGAVCHQNKNAACAWFGGVK